MEQNQYLDIKGATTKKELKTLSNLAKKVPANGLIVEIGAYKGRATVWLAHGAKDGNNTKVYAVDLFSTPNVSDWLEEFKENTKNLDDNIEIIVSDTVAASCKWNKGEVDLIFIDADHSYEGILGDFGSWYKHLKFGGTIAFHDTTPVIREILRGVPMQGFVGIRKVVTDLIMRSNKFKHVHLVNSLMYATKCEQRTFFDTVRSYAILTRMRLRYGMYKIYRLGTKLSPNIRKKVKNLIGAKNRTSYREDAHRHY